MGKSRTNIKWLDGRWVAFGDDCSHFSAGILEVCDTVEDHMRPKLKDDEELGMRVNNGVLIYEAVPKKSKKLSKSDK